ncbi:MAG: sodium-dependent bicarbonate transport family permease [Planctomycetes bacterium]|nr:sodium-dependent bicarbonate transport family permease [Planctomycetota bacterium]MCB9892310.1 sodium-dependent bicarbonate transport family permease [Planctomycetota bacterium]
MGLDSLAQNLLAPPILFFLLGTLAAVVRAELEIPQPVTRTLALYLLFSIGLHGGVELAHAGFRLDVFAPLLVAVACSAIFPVGVFFLWRRRLGPVDAAAIAATYGSISAVTFITATSFLDLRDIGWSGSMIAAMALMESPAILVGVILARMYDDTDTGSNGRVPWGSLLREAFLNGPVFLLLGSLMIGMAVGESGWKKVAPFAHEPFQGVLCLFLLDMGLIAGRRLGSLRKTGLSLACFALLAPLVQGSLGITLAHVIGLGIGDALLLTVLCASASYIAVPAAVRMNLPKANPGLFLPMSLAVTFPFNIALGIPIYLAVIERLWT